MIGKKHLQMLRSELDDRLNEDIQRAVVEFCEQHSLNAEYLYVDIHVGINPDLLGSQPPLCDCYDDGPALVMWPSGKVQMFPDLAKALTMLQRQYYEYVVKTPNEAFVLYQEYGDSYKEKLRADDEHVATAPALWQYLKDIAEERNPWASMVHSSDDSSRLTKRATSSGYRVHHDKCKAMLDAKAPKQAKVLADSFLQFEDNGVVTDEDIQKLLHTQMVKGILKTKQDVMRIFAYYRKALLEHGALELRT